MHLHPILHVFPEVEVENMLACYANTQIKCLICITGYRRLFMPIKTTETFNFAVLFIQPEMGF